MFRRWPDRCALNRHLPDGHTDRGECLEVEGEELHGGLRREDDLRAWINEKRSGNSDVKRRGLPWLELAPKQTRPHGCVMIV